MLDGRFDAPTLFTHGLKIPGLAIEQADTERWLLMMMVMMMIAPFHGIFPVKTLRDDLLHLWKTHFHCVIF